MCCVAVLVQLETPIIMCAFSNPAKKSPYRYTTADFILLTSSLLLHKHTSFILCGDINFPQTNWNTNQSTDSEENDMLNILEQLNAEHIVHVPTCGRNTLDVVYAHNVSAETYVNTSFEKVYDISNH